MGFASSANTTNIAKRDPAMKVEKPEEEEKKKGEKEEKEKKKEPFDCSTATYKTVTLDDFVYKHNCFPAGWDNFLKNKEVKNNIGLISKVLENDAKVNVIEPPMPHMFKAFTVTPDKIKAVIIGQDPTPQPGKATGLAFSLKPNEDPRGVPSVFNMIVELKLEGMAVSLTNGDLSPWLNEGVLLLNAALTVIQGEAGSHQKYWRQFTRKVVAYISYASQPSAWMLWGDQAKKTAQSLIDRNKHYIRIGGHPSPLGGNNFFGRNYFHCANAFLVKMKRGAIKWQINHRLGFDNDMEPCYLT